uniref:Uncharacterized protein n=1 Tax=Paramoeba aestuarina TaxID=180227 RepID=A0A7S4UD61_9EUKA
MMAVVHNFLGSSEEKGTKRETTAMESFPYDITAFLNNWESNGLFGRSIMEKGRKDVSNRKERRTSNTRSLIKSGKAEPWYLLSFSWTALEALEERDSFVMISWGN